MTKCNHLRRSALGDEAIVNSERLREIIPEFRDRHPEDRRSDEEIIDALREVLMAIPRHCSICKGGLE